MAYKWKTVEAGIRTRTHTTRKHGVKPDTYFTLRFYVNGKRTEEALGWASQGWTLTKARAELARLKEAQRTGHGEVTLAEKRQKAQREREAVAQEQTLTLQGIFDNGYLQHQQTKNKKPDAIRNEQGLLHNYLVPFFGDAPLKQIDTRTMDAFVAHLNTAVSARTKKPLSDATKRHAIALVSQIFNYAISRIDHTMQNPVRLVTKPRSDNARQRFLSVEEAQTLLKELSVRSQDTHDICLLSLFCGMRASEILSLTWGDVNFAEQSIHIKDAKNGESRHAYMTAEVNAVLRRRECVLHEGIHGHALDARVFKGTEVSRTFERVVENMGLNAGRTDARDRIVFHSLRHTFASWQAKAGTPLYTIGKLLGHKTLTMTQRYAHLCPSAERDAAMTLQGIMDTIRDTAKTIPFAKVHEG